MCPESSPFPAYPTPRFTPRFTPVEGLVASFTFFPEVKFIQRLGEELICAAQAEDVTATSVGEPPVNSVAGTMPGPAIVLTEAEIFALPGAQDFFVALYGAMAAKLPAEPEPEEA